MSEGMVPGQDCQCFMLRVNIEHRVGLPDVDRVIALRQHDPFRIRGCARCVGDIGEVVGLNALPDSIEPGAVAFGFQESLSFGADRLESDILGAGLFHRIQMDDMFQHGQFIDEWGDLGRSARTKQPELWLPNVPS